MNMPVDDDTQRLLDIYAFVKATLELCEAEVIIQQNARGDAEVFAIVKAMTDDFAAFWNPFRAKWGIPDHPFQKEILEGIRSRREQEQRGEPSS